MRAFCYCDGEQIQIETFLEDDILDELARALIDLGKSPASCSATCQSSDASPLFRAIKRLLQGIFSKHWESAGLAAALSRIFSSRPNLEGQKSRLIPALQQIICAIRTVMKDEIIKEGYACIGQYPFCFKTIMSKCTTTIPDIEFRKMEEALPDLSVYFSRHGRLSEEIMDQKLIMSVNDQASRQKPKDQRVLPQERAILLTAQDSIAKYKNHQLDRIITPLIAAERLEMRKRVRAERIMAAEAKKKATEERKAARDAEK